MSKTIIYIFLILYILFTVAALLFLFPYTSPLPPLTIPVPKNDEQIHILSAFATSSNGTIYNLYTLGISIFVLMAFCVDRLHSVKNPSLGLIIQIAFFLLFIIMAFYHGYISQAQISMLLAARSVTDINVYVITRNIDRQAFFLMLAFFVVAWTIGEGVLQKYRVRSDE